MKRIGRGLGFGALLVSLGAGFAGCGGDDEKSNRGGSYSDIMSAIESPSGTVDETTVADVGAEFEKVTSVDVAAGNRRDAQTAQGSQSGTLPCDAGGNISYGGSGSGSGQSGQATLSYNECCVSAGCCVSGRVEMFVSSAQGAEYTSCGSYDLTSTCDGSTATLEYEGCIGTNGQVYIIEANGETYTVSGFYSDGSGTLEITGENGTWSCTFSGGSGSCTGEGGNFTF